MLGPYAGLMKSSQGMNQGMQATPVHHVGKGTINNPEQGSIKEEAMGFLSEIEGNMKKFRVGSPVHNKLLDMRGQVLMDLADMDVEHQGVPDEATQNLTTRLQNLKAKTVPYQRGITPEGNPAR